MKIFGHYLLRNLLTSLLVATLILTLIIGGRLLIELSQKTAEGSYPADLVSALLMLGVADSMIHLLPFCVLLAVIMTLSNLYQNNEIYAAYSICISKLQIYSVLLRFAIPISLLLLYLVLEVLPIIQQQFEFIKQEGQQRIDISTVDAGRFAKFDDGVLFVKQHDDNQVGGIFLSVEDDTGSMTLTTALEGQQHLAEDGSKTLQLQHGDVYQKNLSTNGETSFYKISYQDHQIRLPEQTVDIPLDSPQTFGWMRLWESNSLDARAELQKRLSIPLSLLILLPFIEWLSRSSPTRYRQQSKLALGIVVFLVYSNLTILITGLIESGQYSAEIGVWPLHFVVLSAGLMLALRRDMY